MSDKKEKREKELFQRRRDLTNSLFALANISAGSFIFGQALSQNSFSWLVAVVGLIVTISLYLLALMVMQKGDV